MVTHLVTCVRTPPRTVEKIAPIGAPAEKVANAIEREGPGGNALARIPSWWGSAKGQGVRTENKENPHRCWDYRCGAYAL